MASVRSRDDPLRTAAVLAFVGGFLDGYTYIGRGGIFANAQTGNVVLTAVEFARGHLIEAARHLPSLGAYVLGLIAIEVLAARRFRLLRRPARVVLVVEIVVLAVVGVLSTSSGVNLVATSLVSFVAAMQVSAFRQTGTASYNTTITTGNLRSLVIAVWRWRVERDAEQKSPSVVLGVVVVMFAIGAGIGGLATHTLGRIAVLLVLPLLVVVLADVVLRTRTLERAAAGPTGQNGPARAGTTEPLDP